MPLPFILGPILAWAAVAAVVVLVVLNWNDILAWFNSRNDLQQSDKNHVAFTLQERLKNGNYKTIQGIFNKMTSQVVEGQVLQHEKMDGDLAKAHENQPLVVYT